MTDTKFPGAAVNLASGNATITTENALLRGVHVQVTMSNHAVEIKNGVGGTTLFRVPAGALAGRWIEAGDMRFPDGIQVVPNASSTGTITLVYKAQKNFVEY